jgi:ATPase family AAA domain-containing protein 3A/B
MSGANIQQFDPTGLERGAKALREINASPHAAKAMELSLAQERSRQAEGDQKKSENDAKMWEKRKEYLEVIQSAPCSPPQPRSVW